MNPSQHRRHLLLAAAMLLTLGTAAAMDRTASTSGFTIAQARQGHDVFEQNCAACHASSLQGSSHGPALRGTAFIGRWGGKTSGDLLGFVRSAMPPGGAGTLSEREYVEVVAYILSRNGHAPGRAALAAGSAIPISRKTQATRASVANPDSEAAGTGASLPAIGHAIGHYVPVTERMLTDPPPGDWLNWRRTRDGQGYSPLDQITAANVGSLRLAWVMAMPDGVFEPTPMVHDGVMFVPAPGGGIRALDAATGDFLWDYRYESPAGGKVPPAPMRNLALYGKSLYLTTPDAALVAIDAATGKQLWRVQQADPKEGFTHTAGPAIAHGVVVSGINGCERFKPHPCFIAGNDPETGRERWRLPVIAQPGDPNDATWGGLEPEFRAGGDMWIPGTYDPVLDTFYIGTAQAKPWTAAGRHMKVSDKALYTDSTLAIDPVTGRLKWWFQHTPGDTLDMDDVFERVLVDIDGRKDLLTIGKLGIVWKLDRQTGAYVDLVPTVYQDIFTGIDRRTGKLTWRPDIVNARLGDVIKACPSTFGGHDRQAMAYDPDQGAIVIPLTQMCGGMKGVPVAFRPGGGGAGGIADDPAYRHDMPGEGDAYGRLAAYDVRSLKELWSYRQHAVFTSAALTTAGGLVFAGDADRYFKAFDSRTGKPLWQARLGAAIQGYPIAYTAHGRQYIAVPAGQLGPFQLVAAQTGIYEPPNGNAIYVFALP